MPVERSGTERFSNYLILNRQRVFRAVFGVETRYGLYASTQDHAQTDQRTLADFTGLIRLAKK
jgi:hypothetical protein